MFLINIFEKVESGQNWCVDKLGGNWNENNKGTSSQFLFVGVGSTSQPFLIWICPSLGLLPSQLSIFKQGKASYGYPFSFSYIEDDDIVP